MAKLYRHRKELQEFRDAIIKGTVDELKSLLDKYPAYLNGWSVEDGPLFREQENLLIMAIEHERPDIVEYLIELRANVNIKIEPLGLAPLHVAVNKRSCPLAEILIANGADVHIRNRIDISPLHLAVSRNDIDMVEPLLLKGANPNAVSADHGSLNVVESETLLLVASRIDLRLTQLLINYGAKLDHRSKIPTLIFSR